jgi:nucleoside-diphosphate-sugar epimerase
MKVLFIGGNGNISWHCLKLALDAGHEVYALNRGVTLKTRREFPKEVIKLTGDIRNPEEVKELFRGKVFDVVADFICYNEQHAKTAIELFENITKQYIFISSVTVYQRKTKYLPFKESTPQWENSDYDYAMDKVCAEKIFMEAYKNKSFPVTIVRPAHTYDTIIPVSLGHNCFTAPQRILDGKPALIAGDGTNLWTVTHSKDFAGAFLGLLGNKKAIGEDFHITTDEWLTWLEMTDILLGTLGVSKKDYVHVPVNEILKMEIPKSKNMSVSFLGKDFRGQKMWCDIYDNSKIKSFVPGWSAEISFNEGIKETINWMWEDDVRRRFNPELDSLLEDLYVRYRNNE